MEDSPINKRAVAARPVFDLFAYRLPTALTDPSLPKKGSIGALVTLWLSLMPWLPNC